MAGATELVARIEVVPTILEVVCQTTGMGFGTVARVTEDSWIACGVRDDSGFGLVPGDAFRIEATICNEVCAELEPVIMSDVHDDPRHRLHPMPARLGFRSYVSVPIVLPGGEVFGTLCALDRTPRDLSSPWLIGMFRMFAELIAFHIDARMRLTSSENDLASSRSDLAASQSDLASSRADLAARVMDLADERSASVLREQFIAVLGHDLRNPLASIASGTKLLAGENLSERGRTVLKLVGKSLGRMGGLIDDVLDFARGRHRGRERGDRAARPDAAPSHRRDPGRKPRPAH